MAGLSDAIADSIVHDHSHYSHHGGRDHSVHELLKTRLPAIQNAECRMQNADLENRLKTTTVCILHFAFCITRCVPQQPPKLTLMRHSALGFRLSALASVRVLADPAAVHGPPSMASMNDGENPFAAIRPRAEPRALEEGC